MWKMINYETCGRGHKQSNIPCQDKTICIENKGAYCIALADGAGSAKLSHHGAQTVVSSTAKYLTENFEDLIENPNGIKVKKDIIHNLNENLNEKVKEYKCELNDLASTLLFVAIKDNKFIIGHIGDGIIGYLNKDNILIASKPNNGEFVNSTVFVTSSKPIQNMKLFKGDIKDIKGFVLMSDGSATSFYIKQQEKLSNITKKIIKWTCVLDTNKMQELIKDSFDNLVTQNTTDDCSIAIIAKKSAPNRLDILNKDEKLDLLNIKYLPKRKAYKQLRRYKTMIYLWDNNKNLKQISRAIHLKPKYTERKIKSLINQGIIEKR